MELSSRPHAGWKAEPEVWAGAAVLGAGWGGRLRDGTAMGAAVDNQKTSSSHHQRSLCHTGPAVVREAGRGCCVMLEAQLAESGDGRERASAGSIRVR